MEKSKIDHLPLFDVQFFFGASKNKGYRSRTLMCAHAIADVFTEQGVSKVNLTERFSSSPETFKVSIGDLTDEGFEFARTHYQRWLANSDRWKGEKTYEKFRSTLSSQWAKFLADSQPKGG
jgi:hypothetical protein